jgi:hypothetical protein
MKNPGSGFMVSAVCAVLLTICSLASIPQKNYESVSLAEAGSVYGGTCWVYHSTNLKPECNEWCGEADHPQVEQWTQGGHIRTNVYCVAGQYCVVPNGQVYGWCWEPN